MHSVPLAISRLRRAGMSALVLALCLTTGPGCQFNPDGPMAPPRETSDDDDDGVRDTNPRKFGKVQTPPETKPGKKPPSKKKIRGLRPGGISVEAQ
jgi:hypothetical protein